MEERDDRCILANTDVHKFTGVKFAPDEEQKCSLKRNRFIGGTGTRFVDRVQNFRRRTQLPEFWEASVNFISWTCSLKGCRFCLQPDHPMYWSAEQVTD